MSELGRGSEVSQYLLETDGEDEILCTSSENIFMNVLEQQGKACIVNETFLVKGAGKLVGLCLRDVVGDNGEVVFKRGGLYAPVNETREELKGNFGIVGEQTKEHYLLKTKEADLRLEGAEWVFLRDNNKADVAGYMKKVIEKINTKRFLPKLKERYYATYEEMPLSVKDNKNRLVAYTAYNSEIDGFFVEDKRRSLLDVLGRIRDKVWKK